MDVGGRWGRVETNHFDVHIGSLSVGACRGCRALRRNNLYVCLSTKVYVVGQSVLSNVAYVPVSSSHDLLSRVCMNMQPCRVAVTNHFSSLARGIFQRLESQEGNRNIKPTTDQTRTIGILVKFFLGQIGKSVLSGLPLSILSTLHAEMPCFLWMSITFCTSS